MLAKLDNFGPFHLFFTLSCGDMRWKENFTSILIEKGWTIIWNKQDQTDDEMVDEEVEVQLEDGSVKPLEEFLQEDANETTHEFIRSNVFTATRNFVHRINCFKRNIMMGVNNPMCIHKFSWKTEFQGRGAGHIHGTLWCNLRKIELHGKNMDGSDNNSENLEAAFIALREKNELSCEAEKSLIKFADKFTSCTLNSDKAMEHLDAKENVETQGKKIIEIVKDCQIITLQKHTEGRVGIIAGSTSQNFQCGKQYLQGECQVNLQKKGRKTLAKIRKLLDKYKKY